MILSFYNSVPQMLWADKLEHKYKAHNILWPCSYHHSLSLILDYFLSVSSKVTKRNFWHLNYLSF